MSKPSDFCSGCRHDAHEGKCRAPCVHYPARHVMDCGQRCECGVRARAGVPTHDKAGNVFASVAPRVSASAALPLCNCERCLADRAKLPHGLSLGEVPRVSVAVALTNPSTDPNRGVLLVKHRTRGWEFPVGKVEPGELLIDAAARELREETGVVIEPHFLRLIGKFELRGFGLGHWVNFMFAADSYNRSPGATGEPIDLALDGMEWWSWAKLDRLEEMWSGDAPDGAPARHDAVIPPGKSGISRTAWMIVHNARQGRERRDPGYQTHCWGCLGEIPCRCMRGLR